MSFRLLDKTDLNIKKWDAAVLAADNGRVNALSWYLDIVCAGKWKALVQEDYALLLPLPLNVRIPFVNRISVPPFSQQLGIIGQVPIQEEEVTEALSMIPSYRQVIMQWNESNKVSNSNSFDINMRPNFVLELNKPIDELRKVYSKNLRRHLKKVEKIDLDIKNPTLEVFEKFYLDNTDKQTNVTPIFKSMFGKLIRAIIKNNYGMIRGVYHQDRLIAACLFTNFNNRITSLLIRSNKEGKEHTAMHYLMDQTISKFSNSDYFFDFEGSSIESIARFFKSFGAESRPYPILKRSRFPF